jgi:hypothetical protein
LLPDTKLLLENWDEAADVQANLDRVRRQNLFGKASRSRVEDVLLIFRQRYLKDSEVLEALVTLVKGGMPAESLDRVLYFQAGGHSRGCGGAEHHHGDKRLLRQEERGTQVSPKRIVHGQRDRDILERSRAAGTSRTTR